MFRSKDGWPSSLDQAMDRLAKTMDRIFGSDFMSEVEKEADKATRKPKRKSPGFTTPGRLAVGGKIPRWASPWVAVIHNNLPNFEIYGQPSQVERACMILESLLLAGFTPPNADVDALQRWRENADPSPSLTNEPADAGEETHGPQDPQTEKETPRSS